MMTTGNKPAFPTTTIHAIRLCLFQSTRRPTKIEKIVETSFGKIRIKGRLGQQHLDVFETICFSREKKKDVDGRIHILVDPREVRNRSEQMSGSTLKGINDDLMQAIIEIIEPKDLACTGHLIDHIDGAVKNSTGEKITRRGPFGERELWTVKLGEAFCKLVKKDIWIGYDPAPIARLNHGISQAVARHVLTHKTAPNGGWKLNTLIEAVAGPLTGMDLRNARRRLKNDSEGLLEIGVIVDADRINVEHGRDFARERAT